MQDGSSALAEHKDTHACGSRKKKREYSLSVPIVSVSLVLRAYAPEVLCCCRDSSAGLSKRGLQLVFTGE
jgi:hypothetical protein